MPIHMWGDKDFDWAALHDAMVFISKRSAEYGLMPIMKEKYGTIRYEWVELWKRTPDGSWTDLGVITAGATGEMPSPEELELFEGVLLEAKLKFPHISDEIVEDWWNPYTGIHTYAEHLWE